MGSRLRAGVAGVEVVAVGPTMPLYSDDRRRLSPPISSALGVLTHLLRRGHRYDVVHTASFPYFSLLAAATARRLAPVPNRRRLDRGLDPGYWLEYLGPFGGRLGWRVQRLCADTKHRAFCLRTLHARRLREQGFRGEVTILGGQYAGPLEAPEAVPAEEVVVFAGRHIPEKRVTALVRRSPAPESESRRSAVRSMATGLTEQGAAARARMA